MTTKPDQGPVTRLCTHTLTSLHYRDANLVEDLMGKKTFTEVMLMQILGRTPRPVDLRITDVVLIVLMEHGLTPSAIATRLIYMSAPENLQGAVSAGLLAVGSSFVGTMENCSRLLDRIGAAADPDAEALAIARHYKEIKGAVPGFGHHLHKPVDPRAYKLLEMGRAEPDLAGDKIRALERLSQAVDAVAGRPITINATGAVAALLGEIGVPTGVMRGFAVISRAAGLVAHIVEEQQSPSGRFIWDTVEEAIPYVGEGGNGGGKAGGAGQ
ncbi:citryl-CoA lyase [Cupriavidus sp. USMAA2-4]|uniref:citrate synthase (unknown stereospecificity) n=1 Tax=Cupriavidus malaysiensis TaxID=367825 RepID=A0ABM6FCY3_9BURK|nr:MULTISPECIES: citryl-CoA lyase [Cupriavidus]AOY96613.1 citryl-CoA lyase [Cupriavidus sp. USMAA2-4]AOZ09647.1 citryl-CoA lyase [Cupriavidus malaysiensis]